MAKKKNYIGWIVSRLYGGEREFVLYTMSPRRSDAIQNYMDNHPFGKDTWRSLRKAKRVQIRVHKVTEIKVAE